MFSVPLSIDYSLFLQRIYNFLCEEWVASRLLIDQFTEVPGDIFLLQDPFDHLRDLIDGHSLQMDGSKQTFPIQFR
jgi:hypothetical protein